LAVALGSSELAGIAPDAAISACTSRYAIKKDYA
jgi:hypothetical protein